jgi:hypothetical protein
VGRSPRQPKVKLIRDWAGAPAASTREFHYQSDAIVEERLDGVTTHRYLVDEGGSIVEVISRRVPTRGPASLADAAAVGVTIERRIRPADRGDG